MSDLQKKINQRKAIRIQTSSVIKRIEKQLSDENATHVKLLGLQNNLVNKIEQLNMLNDEVLALLKPEEVEQDVLESMEYTDPTHELLAAVTLKLQSLSLSPPSEVDHHGPDSVRSVSSRCRLPKFELPIFKGDPLCWQGFWDQFSASIHDNEEISDIDRFNYLKRYVEGQASETISGLSLSSTNYKEAIKILTERYGNPQVLISAHMDCLIRLNKVTNKSDIVSLRKLYNGIENCTRNLSALKLDISAYGSLLIPLLKEKLPDDLNMIIARKFGSDIWTLERLMIFFNDELTAYENCKPVVKPSAEGKMKRNDEFFTSSCLHRQNFLLNKSKSCLYCNGNDHLASRCRSVTEVVTRKELLRKQGRCFVCLATGHLGKNCPSNYSCRKCKHRHHISICSSDGSQAGAHHNNFVSSYSGVLMQTASADVSDTSGNAKKHTRILFDSGSQRSYLSQDLCKTLKLKPLRKEKVIVKTFGSDDSRVQDLQVYQVKIKHKNCHGFCFVEAYCVPNVCSPLTHQYLEFVKASYPHVEGLELADRNVNCRDLNVNLLIGLDFYYSFFTGKMKKGSGGPVALETTLGWVLSGKYESEEQKQHCLQTQHVMKVEVEKKNELLRNELKKFWQVESVGGQEISVINDFENHIYHDGSRYVTRLPFKPDHDPLPDNYFVSERRLRSTAKKLHALGIYDDYDNIFKQYVQEGIIEKVGRNELIRESGNVHYLPHRAVVREDKQTTKIRVVFDASSKANGPSLNDCLYSGPNLLCKIFDVLFRFRLNKIAIIADIRQAFLNISIDQPHRDFLRFLWFEENKVVIYRFLRVVFGLTSSPFLLNGTIRQHLNKFLDMYSEIVKKLGEDLYVDDTTTGCNSVEEGKKFQEVAVDVMSKAGFELRKWFTNNNELQVFFDRRKGCDKTIGDDMTFAKSQVNGINKDYSHKVLGLTWDKHTDCFLFDFNEFIRKSKACSFTKRNVLSLSASMYDPLGIISPITAQIKTFFQSLCVDKSDWDEVISGGIEARWIDLLEKIEFLSVVRVPRFSFVDWTEVVSAELHGFCDSSLSLYCALVYVRIVTKVGIKVFFWTSKTRVSPLKTLSIPRLELLGCLLLSTLIEDVTRAIAGRIKIDRIVGWTDSQVALCWIRGKERTWKSWIENRVVKIRKIVSPDMWFHVAGVENPADPPTRSIDDFVSLFNGIWFNGPSFLLNDNIHYDVTTDFSKTEVEKELKASTDIQNVLTVTEQNAVDLNEIVDFSRYGSLNRLIHVVAYVIRFKNNLIAKIRKNEESNNDENLNVDEVTKSLDHIVRAEQQAMTKNSNFNKTKSNLNVYQDTEGFFRLKSRFGESKLTDDQKHPLLLREGSHVTMLIVRNAHEEVLHFGVESTLAKIRERFWILRGRKTVRNVLRRCVICRRFQGRTMTSPESPDLPVFRVDHLTQAFATTGLDYAGPLFVRIHGHSCSKVYILLFTCASSRAIHLELTPDMKSPAFIRGFKRFVSRRGKPNEIVSDNFKTFKSSEVKAYMLKMRIGQRFILPASPWWGGFYERLVRSVKTSLKKILRKSFLTFEELQTVLCEVESVINSRPLCYASDEDVGAMITPNHLIFGRSLNHATTNNQPITVLDVTECTRRVLRLRTVLEHFWKRFSITYLNELRQRHLYERKKTADAELRLNDIVLIKDDTPTPRSQWKIGKIEKLIVGKDGRTRGAKLKVNSTSGRSTYVHRPVQKLIPFEVIEEEVKATEAEDNQLYPMVIDEQSSGSSGGACDEHRVESRTIRCILIGLFYGACVNVKTLGVRNEECSCILLRYVKI
ncbi:uncharacterized protein LOC130646050 [Hydractinia symbiolongicarpus]|uniref:uncharacterized protein LOC130646050 n=1 Tax=Hydractinia symbiolongicarpus TaxID=13093 RepID=UPI0025500F28|nr:uncharacterized protein LOC130646050 [Hydractinia symbiolongicarpus]